MSFLDELRRRNVLRVAAAYGVASWLLIQVIDVVLPILGLPESIARTILFLLVIGFITAVIFAWAFERTSEGLKLESEVDRSKPVNPETGRTLDRSIIIVLAIAVVFLLIDKFLLQPGPNTAEPLEIATRAIDSPESENGPANGPVPVKMTSVAVLPFIVMSTGPDDAYFADGLTEEIINALTQLPELLVTARTSAFHFKGQNLPVEEIAGQLGVDHVVEGSVRRAGSQLRITAQLVRAVDGFHIWSESYDRPTEDTLAVQSDIAESIAAALNVVLDAGERERMRQFGVRNVAAYTAYQKGIELMHKAHEEGTLISLLRQANVYFEAATALAPNFSDAYLQHSDLYSHILLNQANGVLDGNIIEEDLAVAPGALKADYDRVIEYARRPGQRLASEYDRALLLGRWHGLAALSERALTAPGCEAALWAQLASGAFGTAQLLRNAFERRSACDPLRARPWIHIMAADLWLGRFPRAVEIAETRMQVVQYRQLAAVYVTALGMAGRGEEAALLVNGLNPEDERLRLGSLLAAMRGDDVEAGMLQDQYLGKYGPNDYSSLMLEAVRGHRSEANRLAALIDRRPFGYMALMMAVYNCFCGAPFDLEATPVYASMLVVSGLPWPPEQPFAFPLKHW